ncbi:MAG: bifunctional 4-hydroxy-2-oxoglutarate aldolase/2-dehydro-3-deoxy-phosphogluconate aldolase [Chitinophagaceae bacterium]
MHKKEKATQLLEEQKLLPLYYHDSEEVSISILTALYSAGIRMVEYTNRGERAGANFNALKKHIHENMPGLLLGIGTIKTAQQCTEYIAAGADFIVCPIVNPEVAGLAHAAGLLWIPGCLTPTEIALAENAGARIIKIFPGNVLGPSYINAIKELFPGIRFMPTGGVEATEQNLREWFKSGVVAVGMGSKLISRELVEAADFDLLSHYTVNAMKLVKEAAAGVELKIN